jgi:hypothetical protein
MRTLDLRVRRQRRTSAVILFAVYQEDRLIGTFYMKEYNVNIG